MTTLKFLIKIVKEINPSIGYDPDRIIIEWTRFTVEEFSKLRTAVLMEYAVILRVNHMFECVDFVEMSYKIDNLIFKKENTKVEATKNDFMLYKLHKRG